MSEQVPHRRPKIGEHLEVLDRRLVSSHTYDLAYMRMWDEVFVITKPLLKLDRPLTMQRDNDAVCSLVVQCGWMHARYIIWLYLDV